MGRTMHGRADRSHACVRHRADVLDQFGNTTKVATRDGGQRVLSTFGSKTCELTTLPFVLQLTREVRTRCLAGGAMVHVRAHARVDSPPAADWPARVRVDPYMRRSPLHVCLFFRVCACMQYQPDRFRQLATDAQDLTDAEIDLIARDPVALRRVLLFDGLDAFRQPVRALRLFIAIVAGARLHGSPAYNYTL